MLGVRLSRQSFFKFRGRGTSRDAASTSGDKISTSSEVVDKQVQRGLRAKLLSLFRRGAVSTHYPNPGHGSSVKAAKQVPALTAVSGQSEVSTSVNPVFLLDNQHLAASKPPKINPPPPIAMDPVESRLAMPTDASIGLSVASRPEDFNVLKEILSKKLGKDVCEDILRDFGLVPQRIAESLVKELNANVEVLGVGKKERQKKEIILAFIQRIAKTGTSIQQNMHPDVAALAWDMFRGILQVVTNDIEMKKIIETAEGIVVTALDMCKSCEDIYPTTSSTHRPRSNPVYPAKAIVELYAAVIIFCAKSKKYLESSGIVKSMKNAFTSASTELQSLINEVKEKTKDLQGFMAIASTKGQDTHNYFDQILDYINSIGNAFKTEMGDLKSCRTWLGGLEDSQLEYDKLQEARASGTCEWILDNKVFNSWMEFHKPTLLINGMPGAGKSVLLAFIISKLRHQSQGNQKSPSPILLHFFFKNGNPKTESPITMLATLVDQFIMQLQSSQAVHILKTAKEESNAHNCGSFRQLWHTFMELLEDYSYDGNKEPVTILIDALDECAHCDDRSKLLKYIGSSAAEYDWVKLGVRFVVTSRQEEVIMDALKSGDSGTGDRCLEISLSNELLVVNKDIIRFAQGLMATDKYRKLQSFKQEICEILLKKSQGMFRYAALMLDQLLEPSRKDFSEILSSIPTGLNNIYIYILEHLKQDRELLLIRKMVFIWVALAFRPINVNDMALAYASWNDNDDENYCGDGALSEKEFDPTRKILITEQKIREACGPLVEIRRNGTLAFTHFSVKEFLLVSDSNEQYKDIPYDCKSQPVVECLIRDLGIAHRHILKSCMTQLSSATFLRGQKTQMFVDDDVYSTSSWDLQGQEPQMSVDDDVYSTSSWDLQGREPQMSVDDDVYSTSSWDLQGREPQMSVDDDVYSTFSWNLQGKEPQMFMDDVYSTSYWVLHAARKDVQHLHSAQAQSSKQALHPWPAVCQFLSNTSTCFTRWIEVVPKYEPSMEDTCLYFEYTPERKLTRPLHVMACFGLYIPLVQALEDTDMGQDVDVLDVFGKSPLTWAAEKGHTEVVKLLLEKNADMEIKDGQYGQTPLSWAARNRFTEIVKLLLEKNADIETKGVIGRTPLSWAAGNGHMEVVKLLLEKGADIKAEDNRYGRTPLSWASENGRIEVVKLLLEIDTEDINGPLSWAAGSGHMEVVKLLLEKGADIKAKNNYYGRTPLSWASGYGRIEVVKVLLEMNADIETKDINGRTPLSLAAGNGHTKVVKLLLEKNANTETKYINGRTSLSLAAGNGHTKVVKLLLEKNANTEAKDMNGQTPLSWAAKYNRAVVAELLLAFNAKIETRDIYSRTPLSLAAEYGHVTVAGVLLGNKADIESRDMYGGTPLSWAARNNQTQMVKLLFTENADLEAKDVNGLTPVAWASENFHPKVVTLLELAIFDRNKSNSKLFQE